MIRLPDLTGKTVLVVGGAPCDISAIVADYVIAASSGIKSAPNADMLVTIDNAMPSQGANADIGFAGLRVVGAPSDDPTHLFHPFPYEAVEVAGRGTIHVRNNGVSAIRTAVECGASKVLLAGFDPVKYDAANAALGYDGVIATALPALILELAGRGVTVEYCAAPMPVQKRGKTWPMST